MWDDNSIANLNSKGKNVLGWKYSNKESINQELFHFKKSDKDETTFIYFKWPPKTENQ